MDCYFCQRNIKDIDYKDTQLLRRFISAAGKIKPKKRPEFVPANQRN